MSLPKIDSPIYETELISNGMKIKYRPFLMKEQKIFLMAAESDDPEEAVNSIKQVLNNCVLTEGVDVNELPSFDLEHIFIQLRRKSVGDVSNLNYKCNNMVKKEGDEEESACGAIIAVDLDLSKIKVVKSPEHTNKVFLTDKMGICFKYPSFNNISELNVKSELDILDLIVSCIDYIFDDEEIYYAKDYSTEELNEFIDGMSQESFDQIKVFFNTMPKSVLDVTFKCGKCGYEEELHVEGIQNFFS